MMKEKFEIYPENKDSAEEWLGEIPETWNIKKVFHHFLAKKGSIAAKLTKEFCENFDDIYNVYSGQTDDGGVMGKVDFFEFNTEKTGLSLIHI